MKTTLAHLDVVQQNVVYCNGKLQEFNECCWIASRCPCELNRSRLDVCAARKKAGLIRLMREREHDDVRAPPVNQQSKRKIEMRQPITGVRSSLSAQTADEDKPLDMCPSAPEKMLARAEHQGDGCVACCVEEGAIDLIEEEQELHNHRKDDRFLSKAES